MTEITKLNPPQPQPMKIPTPHRARGVREKKERKEVLKSAGVRCLDARKKHKDLPWKILAEVRGQSGLKGTANFGKGTKKKSWRR